MKPSGETTLDVDYTINDSVNVNSGGTLNLLDGGVISGDVFAANLSIVNITGGGVGGWITADLTANVTVFGTGFSITNGTIDPSGTYFTPIPFKLCLLEGTYGGGAGSINLTFYVYTSGIQIFLAAPGGETLEAELWVLPCFINRDRPRPARILTLLRLPEGIAKDDIDSCQPLLLDPGGIEAANQYAFEWYRNGILHTSIIASFNKAELMDAVPDDGEVELQVAGQLNTGQEFYGIQTVTIFSWP